MNRFRRFPNGWLPTWGRRLACALLLGCTPAPGDLGGTLPPPNIEGDVPPVFGGALDFGTDGNPGAGETLVFDITVEATALSVTGIAVEAELLVVAAPSGGSAGVPFSSVTLRDVTNGSNDVIGIVGGVFLTAAAPGIGSAGSGAAFVLSEGQDGETVATFAAGRRVDPPNRFILPADGGTFVPGVVGITFEVQSGSRFDFRINGDSVSGTLELTGTSLTELGGTEVYNGTFSGSRRS